MLSESVHQSYVPDVQREACRKHEEKRIQTRDHRQEH